MSKLKVIPLELRELNALVTLYHRHHKPVQGHRFSIGVMLDGKVVGGASVGRPVARKTNQRTVVEVTRLVTDGTKNACSALYSAAARVAKELGYLKIQTFILDDETGVSLRAAGWALEGESKGRAGWHSRDGRRDDQPECVKHRYSRLLQ
jgi:hypothetical protein